MYHFFIETIDGHRTEWRGLTLRQAQSMHTWTERRTPDNVKRFGWECVE